MQRDANHVVSARTRVAVGLAVLDIARQVSRAWASRRATESDEQRPLSKVRRILGTKVPR